MDYSTISKYYDLRFDRHVQYVSPVEHRTNLLQNREGSVLRVVDTVSISKEARLRYKNYKGL